MIAPADEHDALPFEGEGAHGGGMVFTFGDLFEDKYFGPVAVEEGLTGIFEEGLMDEVGPTPATMKRLRGQSVNLGIFCSTAEGAVD